MKPLSEYTDSIGQKISSFREILLEREKYAEKSGAVIEEERAHIREEKEALGDGDRRYYGLALSGGGIRSASFGMGVLQALVDYDKLKKIDYLSTVSGGGYTGASLTWFLRKRKKALKRKKGFKEYWLHWKRRSDSREETDQENDQDNGWHPYGTTKENFPFGRKGIGARFKETNNAVLDFIRQHSNYLIPGSGLNAMSLFGIAVRTIFISLSFYVAAMSFAIALMNLAGLFSEMRFGRLPIPVNPLLILSGSLIAGALAFALFFSLRTFFTPSIVFRYRNLIFGQRILGIVWSAVFILIVAGSLPFVLSAASAIWQRILVIGLPSLAGILAGGVKFIREQSRPARSGKLSAIGTILASFALVYGLMLISFTIGSRLAGGSVRQLVIFGICTALFGLISNINFSGPHNNYRNRLMEAFLPNDDNVQKNRWGAATEADTALLCEMCGGERRRPYHLINTNVVLVDSPVTKYRYRGGDSFILSPLYCGSDATGWRSTMEYKKLGFRGITLATAMAISGAAANPYTGPAGQGITRNILVSILMALLNLRLGYWIHHPSLPRRVAISPNFLFPGLRESLFGSGLKEKGVYYIQLTDGGHFDNLGIYELIRREVDVIIVSDASADPGFRFGDLANAVERARVDFGAVIRFNDKDYGLENLVPGSNGNGIFDTKYQLARKGYAVGEIRYRKKEKKPDDAADSSAEIMDEKEFGKTGTLIYIKSTMIPGLPADIYGYKSRYAKFPDQSTADQFFDEWQFEAYRELGYQLASGMLDDAGRESSSWLGRPSKT